MGLAGGEAPDSVPYEADELAGLFVIITDEQSFCFNEPFVQEVNR